MLARRCPLSLLLPFAASSRRRPSTSVSLTNFLEVFSVAPVAPVALEVLLMALPEPLEVLEDFSVVRAELEKAKLAEPEPLTLAEHKEHLPDFSAVQEVPEEQLEVLEVF
jgi:hypothetical protein